MPQSQVTRAPADTLAIQDVVVRYGFLIDDRDWDHFDQVFTDDAVVDYRPAGLGPFSGRDEILSYWREAEHPYQHMLVAQVIDDVSADEVVVRSKALCPLPGNWIADLMYRDVVVRTPAGWRIKRKETKSYRPATA
jgi:hypothetical protein